MAKALQSLMKVGNELYLDANECGLALRTFNGNKSAMATYVFKRIYFRRFELRASPPSSCYDQVSSDSDIYDDEDEDVIYIGGVNCCKISMRALQSAFKPPKQVEHCEMSLLSDVGKLQFRFLCKSDLVKNTVITILSNGNITTKYHEDETDSVYVYMIT